MTKLVIAHHPPKANQKPKPPKPAKNLLRKKGSYKELKRPYSAKPRGKTHKIISQKGKKTADLDQQTVKPKDRGIKEVTKEIIKEVIKTIEEEIEIDPAHQDATIKGLDNRETNKTTKTIISDPSPIVETRPRAKIIISNALTTILTETRIQTTPVGISDETISPSAAVRCPSSLR